MGKTQEAPAAQLDDGGLRVNPWLENQVETEAGNTAVTDRTINYQVGPWPRCRLTEYKSSSYPRMNREVSSVS